MKHRSIRLAGIAVVSTLVLAGGYSLAQQTPPTAEDRAAAMAALKETVQTALQADEGWWKALDAAERERIGSALAADTQRNLGRGGERDVARAARTVTLMATHTPQTRMRMFAEREYLRVLEKDDPAALEKRLQTLSSDSNPSIVTLAAHKRFSVSLPTTPIEFKYPDLDGKMIDMADYRGKVVLVDFWATWCKPCMAEMPHVKAMYDKYREQGFEVIGVTDDLPADPEKPRASAFTVEQLKAFLKKENMPWPQLWDQRENTGMGPKLLLRQFDVGSLPTTFLFGRDGRLYSKDNRGEKLEQNIRALLGLAAQ